MGSSTLRAVLRSLHPQPIGPQLPWTTLWSLQITSKLKMFVWRLLSNKLPIADHLHHCMPHINPLCVCCRLAMEIPDHLFTTSPFYKTCGAEIFLLSNFIHPHLFQDIPIGFNLQKYGTKRYVPIIKPQQKGK